jgi:pimeloyl-ACP methyl ester carboxylesterase
MRRLAAAIFFAFALLLAVALGYGVWRSPEKAALDATARGGARGHFIRLPQGMTHYELAGPDSGRTVVLVHGFSVPYYIWDSTASALSEAGYRVLQYDLYGRGLSDRPKATYDGAFYDEQLDALLDSLGIAGPVDLVGLSFGGFVVSHFVSGHAFRVRTLTLVDPMSQRPQPSGLLRAPIIGPWLWKVTVVPGLPEGQMTDFLHPENYPTWMDQYRPQMRYKGFGRALLSTVLMTSHVDFDEFYAAVAETGVPVLLIWGRQDQTVRFELSDVVRRNIPALEFVPVDSAGHLPHIEQAQLVNARLVTYLEGHD